MRDIIRITKIYVHMYEGPSEEIVKWGGEGIQICWYTEDLCVLRSLHNSSLLIPEQSCETDII
jgi:hypothetical protein